MIVDIGEQIVGAYLRIINKCDYINYNVKPNTTGLETLDEFDIVGFNFINSSVYMCEVTTHLNGINYGSYEKTIRKVNEKYKKQRKYAENYLNMFRNIYFQYWSPVIPEGKLLKALLNIDGLYFIANKEYTEKINELKKEIISIKSITNNDFIRIIQIMQNLR